MKSKLKFLWAALSILLVFSLAGCQGGTNPTPAPDPGPAPAETDSPKASDEKTVLRLMGYNNENTRATYLKLLADKFPNVTIQYEFVALDNFSNVLNAQLQAGQGPDIIEVGGDAKLLANAGYLMDLTSQSFVSLYAQSGITPYTVDGNVYALPFQSWYEGIFYNKKIFSENNIQIPKTWDAFIQIHADLGAAGITPQLMGAQSWEPMMKQSIGIANNDFYSDPANKGFDAKFDLGEAKLAEAWLPAVTTWYKAVEAGCLTKDMLGISYDQALDMFANEKGAMWQCGPWAVETIKEKNPDLDFGMFPIPGSKEGPGWLVGGPGSALAVNAKTENADICMQILEATATPEAQLALIADNAGSSFLIGVEADLGPIYADCAEAFKLGNVYAPWTSVWTAGNAIVEAYGKSLQEVLAGTSTVAQALEEADKTNDTMRSALGN